MKSNNRKSPFSILRLVWLNVVLLMTIDKSRADSFDTDSTTCKKCMQYGSVNCLSEDFQKAHCCQYDAGSEFEERCVGKFGFCSKNIKSSIYQQFTCPPIGCPDNSQPLVYEV